MVILSSLKPPLTAESGDMVDVFFAFHLCLVPSSIPQILTALNNKEKLLCHVHTQSNTIFLK